MSIWGKIRKILGGLTDWLIAGRKLGMWDQDERPAPKPKPRKR
jgi:hypothetical protein